MTVGELQLLGCLLDHGPLTAWTIEQRVLGWSPLRVWRVVRDLLDRRLVTLVPEPGMPPDVWQAWPFVCVSLRRPGALPDPTPG